MAKYLFVYHGGGAPQTKEAQAKAMDAWGSWFGSMGADVIDGGHPIGKSTTVKGDGSVVNNGGANPTSGYSVIEAKTLDDAITKAKRCPILESGGSIELAQTLDM